MSHRTVNDLIERLGSADPTWGLSVYADRGDAPVFISYPTLRCYVLNAARRYAEDGVQRGTRVIVPFETSLEVVVAFFALMQLGALPLCVKPAAAGAMLSPYLEFLERIGRSHAVDGLLSTASVRGAPHHFRPIPLPQLDPTPVSADAARVAPTELAFVQFSSGSTSFPKGVPITHANLLRQLDLLVAFDRRTPGQAGATWLPLFHDMGLIGGLMSSLHGQLNLHLWSPRRFLGDPLGWLSLVAKQGVSVFGTPNFAIEYLLRALKAEPEALEELSFERLRHVFVGAEPINPSALAELAQLLSAHGMPRASIQPSYGMAEAVLMVTGGRDTPARVVAPPNGVPCISVGKPLPGFEVMIESAPGSAAAAGQLGEVLLRGGTLADSYFEHSTPLLDAEGFYRTGDIGFVDRGELFVLGRTGERLKLNGESYFAHDFERIVERVPSVRARAAVVLQSRSELFVLVERPKAESYDTLVHNVAEAIWQELGIKVPRGNVLPIAPGQIRRTSSGKLQRQDMLREFEHGRLRTLSGTLPTRLRPEASQVGLE